MGLEKAFSQTKVIFFFIPLISPLHQKKLKNLNADVWSYFDMFQRDLQHLLDAKDKKQFNILKGMNSWMPGQINIAISVEGAHSFQADNDPKTIIPNLKFYKNHPDYKFLHLTLAHLSRQHACVHCFGTKVEINNIDITPARDFQPDPTKIGISKIGQQIIALAYEEPNRILIDIKHMSYVSRQQFYEMRRTNGWHNIPLIVSHAGVTGTRLEKATVIHIGENYPEECRKIEWKPEVSCANTQFNPWTLNLFDEDIEEVILSKGLIGMILEERVLGYGDIFPEYMSTLEVEALKLKKPGQGISHALAQSLNISGPLSNTVHDLLQSAAQNTYHPLSTDKRFTNDIIIDLAPKTATGSQMDYLACNILHILNVGFKMVEEGNATEEDVLGSVCIGSDLDGLMDPMNFPKKSGRNIINELDWVSIDKYPRLKKELTTSLINCLKSYTTLNGNINVSQFINKVFHTNGPDFLNKHFK